MNKNVIKKAFIKSIPIMCSYLFVSMAYGIMMEESGFHWYYSLFASLTIYTGAFQFVLITFLSSGASVLTIAVTAFLMNSRQSFYSLTFVDEFKSMGRKMPYMIHTMTDETYAVNCTLMEENDKTGSRHDIMFLVAFFSRCYWMIGAVMGGILGQLIPFELEGIDFCMTALFVIIFIDQWEKREKHLPAILGLVVSIVCLILLGESNFMLPALIIVSGILLFTKENEVKTA
jgi:4-azaleucine resistance transporter AzlC